MMGNIFEYCICMLECMLMLMYVDRFCIFLIIIVLLLSCCILYALAYCLELIYLYQDRLKLRRSMEVSLIPSDTHLDIFPYRKWFLPILTVLCSMQRGGFRFESALSILIYSHLADVLHA